MEFINQAVTVLQTLVVALGAGLAVWGVVNLIAVYKRQVFDFSFFGKSVLCISLFNCVGFSNVGFSNVGFSNVGKSGVGGCGCSNIT